MRSALEPAVLVDTNVLIYLADTSAGPRNRRASEVVSGLIDAHRAVITAQIVGEFFKSTTAVRPRRTAILSRAAAVRWCETLLEGCLFLETQAVMVLDALRVARDHQMSIFDALIWATARLSGVRTVLTEDLPGQEIIEGVRYLNPFASDFSLARIGL